MIIRDALSFDDVLLVPQHGELASRRDADIQSQVVPGFHISVPVIAANMPSVTNAKMAVAMCAAGGFSILPRFQSPGEQIDELRACGIGSAYCAGAAVGLDDWERVQSLVNIGCTILCLDVAHGDSYRVVEMTQKLSDMNVLVIAGNVATASGALRLLDAGASAIKVGIGPGAACTTREVTGFGVPQLSAILEARKAIDEFGYTATLIADGGIKNSGDIVKALAAGADTVMVGRLLAGCDEAPEPGLYYGNASERINGHNAPEGVEGRVERSGSVEQVMKKLAWGIRSGISYGGGTNIADLRENAEWVRVSPSTHIESGVRLD